MTNQQTIEQQTAATMLQQPVHITLGGERYEVKPPTLATLIEVSAIISQMPRVDPKASVVDVVLGQAKDFNMIGRLFALLILGYEESMQTVKVHWWSRRPFATQGELLGMMIMLHTTPREAQEAMVAVLQTMDLSSFFALTTFLGGLSVTKPTKVDNKPTARGHKCSEQ
jgi:hypothetical protein